MRLVPPRLLGAAVGGLIVLTNSRTILRSFDLEADLGWTVYALVVVLWATALAVALRRHRAERAVAAGADAGPAERDDDRDDDRVPDPV